MQSAKENVLSLFFGGAVNVLSGDLFDRLTPTLLASLPQRDTDHPGLGLVGLFMDE